MRWLLAPLAVALTTACHGSSSSPVAPTAAAGAGAPSSLVLVSGETGQPVAGAQVVLGGQTYTSDSSGQVVVESAVSEIDIEAPGYLERQTQLSADRLTLWPRRSPTGLDEEATGRIVYGCGPGGCLGGAEPLVRLVHGAAAVFPSRELLADPAAMEALEGAARQLSEATRGEVMVTVPPATKAGAVPVAPGSVAVTAIIDPRDPVILEMGAGAVTRRQVNARSEVVRATITFRTLELARRLPLALHEMGHVFGLGHSGRVGDVMWTGPEIYSLVDYSSREHLAIALMLQRAPGNRFPDDGRALLHSQALAGERTRVIACPGF